jgi:hypothetical protein
MAATLFPLGNIVITPGAKAAVLATRAPEYTALRLLERHQTGDWGELDRHDQRVNQQAVKKGHRLLSAYTLETGVKVWVITESDRSVSTILTPDEY